MRKITAVTATSIIFAFLVIAGFPQLSHAGIIYGCYSKANGLLRIVSNMSQCISKETPISWNQAGLQGPAGADGHSPAVSMSGDQITVDSVITGPHLTGPQGPAGTGGVDGMTRVVKGTVDWDGTVLSGTGFTVNYDSRAPGGYGVAFDTPFTSFPSCIATPNCYPELGCLDHMTDADLRVGTDGMTVVIEILQTNAQGQVTTRAAVSLPFTFICAE